MSLTRRRFLFGAGASLLLEQLPFLPAMAQGSTSDYKALVCIFLFGGNDGNNTVIPIDSHYADYFAVRGDGTNGGIGIAQNSLVPLAPTGGSASFGLHPGLADLQGIWNAGRMTVLFNTGTLLEPLSVADYLGNAKPVPQNLFSHADQQGQWQSAISSGSSLSGWGGRISDVLGNINGASPLPVVISTGGDVLYTLGAQSHPLGIPASGSFALNSFGGGQAAAVSAAFNQLLQIDGGNTLVTGANGIISQGMAASAALGPVLTGSSVVDAAFGTLSTSIAKQLHQVARVIAAQSSLGVQRQVFFVSLGGFDTHGNQVQVQGNLLGQLGPALSAFDGAMNQLGTASQVTTFTLSDFARTFKPNTGGGTDHAWGNHHLIMGGAVKGQQLYGTFPALQLGGANDVTQEGRWLPTTSVDQYGATLASWFGVSSGDLATVFPNLGNFSNPNLGFLV